MTKYVEPGRKRRGKSLNPGKAPPRGYRWKAGIGVRSPLDGQAGEGCGTGDWGSEAHWPGGLKRRLPAWRPFVPSCPAKIAGSWSVRRPAMPNAPCPVLRGRPRGIYCHQRSGCVAVSKFETPKLNCHVNRPFSCIMEGVPHITNQVPDTTDGVPDTTDGVPDITGGVPDTTDGVPDIADGVPDITDGVPDIAGGVPDITGGAPDMTDGAPWIKSGLRGMGKLLPGRLK